MRKLGGDTLNGDSDTDRCNGGPGADVEYSCEHTAHESACTERAFDEGLPELPNIVGVFCGVDAAVWLHEFENGAVGIIDNRTGSNVNINGTNKRDLILLNSQHNRPKAATIIYGYDGNDDIDGELGNDEIYGGNGNDELKGGWGKTVSSVKRGRTTSMATLPMILSLVALVMTSSKAERIMIQFMVTVERYHSRRRGE